MSTIKNMFLELYTWLYVLIFAEIEYSKITNHLIIWYKGWGIFSIRKNNRKNNSKWSVSDISDDFDSLYRAIYAIDFEEAECVAPKIDSFGNSIKYLFKKSEEK